MNKPGIQENAFVLPSNINLTSKRIVALQDNDFTFAIPEESQKKLSETFLKVCHMTADGQIIKEEKNKTNNEIL